MFTILGFIVAGAFSVPVAHAVQKTAAEIVAGRFIATPEAPQQVWYVHPGLQTREQVSDWNGILKIAGVSGATLTTKDFSEIPNDLTAATFSDALTAKLKGRILLDVSTGLQWYISPRDGKRYPLRNPEQALPVLQASKLGISQKNLDKIPDIGVDSTENLKLRRKLKGQVLWSVADGSFWYVSPKDLKRYRLETVDDVTALMATQFMGITAANLAKIPQFTDSAKGKIATIRKYSGMFVRTALDPTQLWYVSPKKKQRVQVSEQSAAFFIVSQTVSITAKGLAEIRLVGEADYTEMTVTTANGTFNVKILSSDLSLPGLQILTLGGDSDTCEDACLTFSVGTYATDYHGIAAVNGGYFCPASSASCAGKTDSYYGPLYHSGTGTMINQDQLPTSVYPLLAFDSANTPYYYPQAQLFGSPEDFQIATGATVSAAIANWPALVERGVNVIDAQLLDNGQKNTKTTRVALAVKGKTVSFIIVEQATVTDLAGVAAALGVDYAINLDGGSSTSLWRYGSYLVGPGRTVPNAIVIRRVVQ